MDVTQSSVIQPCAPNQWCQEAAPPAFASTLLKAVWAVNANDVYAVGNTGTILHRVNGTSWAAVASGIPDNLRSVWASSSSDVWVGSEHGAILHFDGSGWSDMPSPSTSDVDTIWGTGPSDVWFGGSTMILHWDGARLTTWGLNGSVLSGSGTGPRDAWVTGEDVTLRHYTGTTWAPVNPGMGSTTLFAVLARGANDVWVTGPIPNKETAHWNGSRWTPFKTNNSVFLSLSALSATDMWGVGQGKVGHWDGVAWATDKPFGEDVGLFSVSTTAGHAWIVGDHGLVAHRTF
jgi:hypothetical protein